MDNDPVTVLFQLSFTRIGYGIVVLFQRHTPARPREWTPLIAKWAGFFVSGPF
jgi:hypothetical protein